MKSIKIISFGYRFGKPAADKVVDVRKVIRNPWGNKEFRGMTGLDAPIKKFVMDCPKSQSIASNYGFWAVNNIISGYRSNVILAVGCTGGKHRSVVIAEAIGDYIRSNYLKDLDGVEIEIIHRDINRKRGEEVTSNES